MACGDEGIGVDESTDCGLIITGLQVIESGILGADIAIGAIFALLPLVFKQKPGVFCEIIAGEST